MRRFLTGLFLLGALIAAPAAAEECNKPLQLITSVTTAPAEDDREILLPVTLGGKDKLFLLDTGGAFTEMSPQAADELGLERTRMNMQLFNVSGEMSDKAVRTSLKIGNLSADNMMFMVAPGTDPLGDDKQIAGILAPDILQHYDLDIDMAAHKVNLMSQDHCEGKVVYWPADAVAVVPILKMDSGHIQVPVTLDGQRIVAMIDTGADNTVLTLPVAESQFGVKPGDADTPKTGTLPDQPVAQTYHHRFASLGFEGIAVTNPDIALIPDFLKEVSRENATPETGTRLTSARSNEVEQSMLLGMDILRHFHMYIAYKEGKVYITPAALAPAVASTPSSTPAAAATH